MKRVKSLVVFFLMMQLFLFGKVEQTVAQTGLNGPECCFLYKNEWSAWERCPGRLFHYVDGSGYELRTKGGVLFFSFRIKNFTPPTKKERKRHRKNNQAFKYLGMVKYAVNDTYPTAEDLAKNTTFVLPNARLDETPTVIRETTCVISVAPYKKKPREFFVSFDNISIGLVVARPEGLLWKWM